MCVCVSVLTQFNGIYLGGGGVAWISARSEMFLEYVNYLRCWLWFIKTSCQLYIAQQYEAINTLHMHTRDGHHMARRGEGMKRGRVTETERERARDFPERIVFVFFNDADLCLLVTTAKHTSIQSLNHQRRQKHAATCKCFFFFCRHQLICFSCVSWIDQCVKM